MRASRSFIWRAGILFSFTALVGSMSVSRPDLLTGNTFLSSIMGPDLVAVLIVVLTITFASVANIHLSVSRMIATAPDREKARAASAGVRGQISSNAWLIFWAFLAALIALFIYGQFPNEAMIRSFSISVCLIVVLLNGLVMHDLYRAIFILAMSASESESAEQQPTSPDECKPVE